MGEEKVCLWVDGEICLVGLGRKANFGSVMKQLLGL